MFITVQTQHSFSSHLYTHKGPEGLHRIQKLKREPRPKQLGPAEFRWLYLCARLGLQGLVKVNGVYFRNKRGSNAGGFERQQLSWRSNGP